MPLKKCTVFFFYMLCRSRNKQMVSQLACLYFMVQFQYVKSHAYKIPLLVPPHSAFRQTNHAMLFKFPSVTAVYMRSRRFFRLETVS